LELSRNIVTQSYTLIANANLCKLIFLVGNGTHEIFTDHCY